MKLISIKRDDFLLWSKFRRAIYPITSHDIDLKEIEDIYLSDIWQCWFVEREGGHRIGLVELSLRNIVDGCVSSPVPYIEGLYLIETERTKGRGTEIIKMVQTWCQEQGYSELGTDAELNNTRAQKFYEKLGFELVDRVVEYKLELPRT